jgi:hypothetical protein
MFFVPTPPPIEITVPAQIDVWHTLALAGRESEYECLANIIQRESRWNPNAIGDSGASVGLGQRHVPTHGEPPQPWLVEQQAQWFLQYADARYGGSCEAWEAWQKNRLVYGWGWW